MMENKILEELIKEGQNYNWGNNSYFAYGSQYCKLSDDYLSWFIQVEDFILEGYGENSAPYRFFKSANIEKANENGQYEFDDQYFKIIAALKACKKIKPKENSANYDKVFLLYNLFKKFHTVVKQLRIRYKERKTIDVEDEYDVQDLLHCLLRLYFDDIRTEEWTPSYAGGSSRMDFLLKNEQIVIEIKKTRKGLNDKELGKQLIEDKAKYRSHPDCKKLICFTYDPDGRIVNPAGIQNDLNSKEDNLEVEVIIKP
jgi:hypothetical protein